MDNGQAIKQFAFAELQEGMEFRREYALSSKVYEAFLAAFDDQNPLHVDDAYARSRGFEGRVMHGGILNGFLSHFVGICCPGRNAILLSTDLRFSQPSYLGDQLEIVAKISQRVESQKVLVLTVAIQNKTRNTAVARGLVNVRMFE